MIRQLLEDKVTQAVQSLVARGLLSNATYPKVEITDTKSPEHGDFACNFALSASKVAQKNPRDLGELLAAALSGDPDLEKAEVAGPGFVNLTVSPRLTARAAGFVLSNPQSFYTSSPVNPLRINVEFVSVNPNGPITVGSGRGAAFGSCLCNVLEAAGHKVHREYYINDGVNSEQMRLFAESVKAILERRPVPENGYKGDYVDETASQLLTELRAAYSRRESGAVIETPNWFDEALQSDKLLRFGLNLSTYVFDMDSDSDPDWLKVQDLSVFFIRPGVQNLLLQRQQDDLIRFGVRFDTWFSEQSLHDSGKVDECVAQLLAKGVADDNEFRNKVEFGKGGEIKEVVRERQGVEDEGDASFDGAQDDVAEGSAEPPPPNPPPPLPTASRQVEGGRTLWLRSTKFGDDMDRVLRRKDGRLTYIASDVAYHQDKFSRGSKPDAGGATEPADKLITILGPDHHGYIGRLHAVVAALLEQPSPATTEAFDENDAKIWKDASEKRDCLDALDEARKRLEVVIFQLVRFVKDGKPAPMRKRDGNIYALIDLINEIGIHVLPDAPKEEQQRAGRDVARFFYLMRSHDTTFDFDLNLAEKQSDENPVFYAQYAHARICGVIEKAREAGISNALSLTLGKEGSHGVSFDGAQDDAARAQDDANGTQDDANGTQDEAARVQYDAEGGVGSLELLTHPKEKALIIKLQDLGYEVAKTAEDYSVNRLTTYAVELARTYHHFYDACRVIQPEQQSLSQARLALCEATKASLKATFDLLGISAPERM